MLLFYIARALNPSGFGLYAIAIAFSQILGLGGNFGVGTAFRKRLPEKGAAEKSRSKLLSNGYFITCIVSAVLAAAGVLASTYLANSIYHNPGMAIPIALASASVFFYSLYNITLAALVGNWRVSESAYSNFGYSISQLVLIVGLVSAGYGIVGAMWGYLLSMAIGFLVGIYFLFKKVKITAIMPSMREIYDIFAFALPVFVSNLLNTGVMNFAVVALGAFATASIVGNYSAAETIGGFVTIIITAISFVILPDFSKVMSDKKLSNKIADAYNESVRYTLLLILPMVVLAVALAVPLMRILVSHSYTTAPLYFAIISLGLMLGVIGNYAGTLLVGFGNTKKFMKYQIAILGVEIILTLALAPIWHAYGVIVAVFIIGSLVSDLLFIKLLKQDFKINMEYGSFASIVASNILLGIILVGAALMSGNSYLSIPIDVAIALLIYPPIMARFGSVDDQAIGLIRNATKGIPVLSEAANAMAAYTEMFLPKKG